MSVSKKAKTLPLAIGALGVVFGDIGTSPLYSMNEIYDKTHALKANEHGVLGGISLIFWVLTITISIKYIIFVLKQDQQGEGGVFALYSLIRALKTKTGAAIMTLLVFSAGFLLGEGVITPAISVLASVEGLEVVSSSFSRFIIPITVIILTGLFFIQSKGTHKVGKLFGPVTLTWFVAIGAIGLLQISKNPEVLKAINPTYIRYIFENSNVAHLLLLLGSVILVITGGEALYADLGHFGKKPIRIAWIAIVYPMLLLNYFGQGAFLIGPESIKGHNIFFSTVPHAFLIPMVLLATCATVIAAQALITGAFSLAHQGMALNLIPKMRVVNTHEDHEGQLYIPFVNWAIYIGTIFLVVAFRSSENLAAAYGLAVSAVMLNTSIALIYINTRNKNIKTYIALPLFVLFLGVDGLFLIANSAKFIKGGYVPVILGLTLALIMFTWRWGRNQIRSSTSNLENITVRELLTYKNNETEHFPRTMIMLVAEHPIELDDKAPAIATLFKDRYEHLPRHLVLLTVRQKRGTAYVDDEHKYEITEFDNDHENNRSLLSIQVNFGFMQDVDAEKVVKELAAMKALSADDDPNYWIIHAAKERVVVRTKARGLQRFRYSLFRTLSRQAQPTYNYFGLDSDSRLSLELISIEL